MYASIPLFYRTIASKPASKLASIISELNHLSSSHIPSHKLRWKQAIRALSPLSDSISPENACSIASILVEYHVPDAHRLIEKFLYQGSAFLTLLESKNAKVAFFRSLTAPYTVHNRLIPSVNPCDIAVTLDALVEEPDTLIAYAKMVKLNILRGSQENSVRRLLSDTPVIIARARPELIWALGVLGMAKVEERQGELRRLVPLQEIETLSFLGLEQTRLGLQRLGVEEGALFKGINEALANKLNAANASSGQAVEAAHWLSAYSENVNEKYLAIAANKIDVLKIEEKLQMKETLATLRRAGKLSESGQYFDDVQFFDRKHRSQFKWAQVRIRPSSYVR